MRFEAELAQFLLDKDIRSRVKPVLEPWIFETEIYRAFALSISNDQFDGIDVDPNILRALIKSDYPSLRHVDIEEVNRLIEDFNEVSDSDSVFVLGMITAFIRDKTYARALQYITENDSETAHTYMSRAMGLSLTKREATNMADSETLQAKLDRKFPKDGKYIRSSLGLVNENCTFKGYRRGDLIQIVSPPGRGKSSFMCQETATFSHQEFKVGYAVIGDNEEDDVSLKINAYYSRDPINKVADDLGSYIEKFRDQNSRINSIMYPMYSVTVKELLSDFSGVKTEHGLDVLIVDYDQNLMPSHESMYESGGLIYGALKAFAQIEDCVVIVASQPKISAWDTEIIGMEAANESSKKQANVDLMLTFNWNPECKQIGTMNIAKIRRGTVAIARIKFNHHISEIEEISQEKYDHILATSLAKDSGCDLTMSKAELNFEE